VRITARFADDIAIVSLSGKFLAGSDGPYLRQKVKDFIDAGTKKLIIDFADVPYIDSTGLGFLVGSRKTAENAKATLVLANLNQHVKRILDNVRLSPFFLIAKNEADALAKLKEQSENPESATKKSKKRSAGTGEESKD
jgi:anti-anti-sigma factor